MVVVDAVVVVVVVVVVGVVDAVVVGVVVTVVVVVVVVVVIVVGVVVGVVVVVVVNVGPTNVMLNWVLAVFPALSATWINSGCITVVLEMTYTVMRRVIVLNFSV